MDLQRAAACERIGEAVLRALTAANPKVTVTPTPSVTAGAAVGREVKRRASYARTVAFSSFFAKIGLNATRPLLERNDRVVGAL